MLFQYLLLAVVILNFASTVLAAKGTDSKGLLLVHKKIDSPFNVQKVGQSFNVSYNVYNIGDG
jgi:hypothetical protein